MFRLKNLSYLLVISFTTVFALPHCNDFINPNSCVTSNLAPSPAFYFDFILDEYITDNNPRLKSLIYSANSNKDSWIAISYHNPNAVDLARRLQSILTKHNIRSLINYESIDPNIKSSKFVNLVLHY